MSKPDWKGAPDGMDFLAKDGTGIWVWHECQPTAGDVIWLSMGKTVLASSVRDTTDDWHKSLERRP